MQVVWACSEDGCDEVWAQKAHPQYCPECSFILYHSAIDRGKTPTVAKPKFVSSLEELRSFEEKYSLDVPVHVPEPIPLDLVQLSTLSRETWVGRPVFHPIAQMGQRANWHRYEIGVVIAIEQDPDFPEEERCRFITGTFHSQSTALAYRPDNLWTPSLR